MACRAVAVGRLRGEAGELILDAEEVELQNLAGSGCFAFLFSLLVAPSTGTPVCLLLWTNYTTAALFDDSELAQARALAEKGARQVWVALKRSIGSTGEDIQADELARLPLTYKANNIETISRLAAVVLTGRTIHPT